MARTRNAATSARPMPRPWLLEPRVSPRHLAQEALRISNEFRGSGVNHLSDRLAASANVHDAAQRRTIALMADFGFELLRLSAFRLLEETEIRFGHWDEVPLRRIIDYATDELVIWARRPGLNRPAYVEAVDCDSENEWLR